MTNDDDIHIHDGIAPGASLEDAWNAVRFVMSRLFVMFGGAANVAQHPKLPRFNYERLLCWVRDAEAIVRSVLLVAALRIAVTLQLAPSPARAAVTKRATPPRAPRGFAMTAPRRARGAARSRGARCVDHEPGRGYVEPVDGAPRAVMARTGPFFVRGPERALRPPPSPWFSTAALQRRLDLLTRVTDAPDAWIARLARRLARKPLLAKRIASAPPLRHTPYGALAGEAHAFALAAMADTS